MEIEFKKYFNIIPKILSDGTKSRWFEPVYVRSVYDDVWKGPYNFTEEFTKEKICVQQDLISKSQYEYLMDRFSELSSES